MADVTGRAYEAFIEFCLRRLAYRDEWTSGLGRQYLYEKHRESQCHQKAGICKHRSSCSSFSKKHSLPYGPWYDPDFLILEEDVPVSCLHITHWSSSANSPFKFWRTIEDHFQYKTLFGPEFLSVNLVFVALDEEESPVLITDAEEILHLHGWKPAVGSVLAISFDSCILFPMHYYPLDRFVDLLPEKIPSAANKKRECFNELWDSLYLSDQVAADCIDQVVSLIYQSQHARKSPRYKDSAISRLQENCWKGRQASMNLTGSVTRYRKGIQLVFLVAELAKEKMEDAAVEVPDLLSSILNCPARFLSSNFSQALNVRALTQSQLDKLQHVLSITPIKMDKFAPQYLLDLAAGIGHSQWHEDISTLAVGFQRLAQAEQDAFVGALVPLFESYSRAYGIKWVIDDLANEGRVRAKINYVVKKYLSITEKKEFVNALSGDLLTPGEVPEHQTVVADIHNWVADALITLFNLGSKQHLVSPLPIKFEKIHKESIRNYSYLGDPDRLVGHLIAGIDVSQHFRAAAKLDKVAFYEAIWPLVAECLWEAMQGRNAIDVVTAEVNYRYKKAMRIVSSPDLEPLTFLFRHSLPNLTEGPTLRGVFNQLSTLRGWSRAALTTNTSGLDPESGAVIQTQSVFGRKHIADKTRELAARIRSVQLRCLKDGTFEPEPDPGEHYLVVDGDWPIESKINLLEAGFSGIFEIGELDRLAEHLKQEASHDDSA